MENLLHIKQLLIEEQQKIERIEKTILEAREDETILKKTKAIRKKFHLE